VGVLTWFVAAGDGSSAASDERSAGEGNLGAGEHRSAEVRALAVAADLRDAGIGRALLSAAGEALRAAGVRRAWLVTTNDNLAALALYQKAGWRLAALRAGAVDEARRTIKPSIPPVGEHGIPIRDELELELDPRQGGLPPSRAAG
jgi:ribosomal protein S18 acetylase RimI-like enzyme